MRSKDTLCTREADRAFVYKNVYVYVYMYMSDTRASCTSYTGFSQPVREPTQKQWSYMQ